MRRFWELLEKNVIVQGLLALGSFIAVTIFYYKYQQVPELLAYGFTTSLGFFFGQKVLKGGK